MKMDPITPAISGLTRRSFIKRSVVAAVAASSMTIFSGLVRADSILYGVEVGDGVFCFRHMQPDQWIFPNHTLPVWKCSAVGQECDAHIPCGRMYEMDPFTGEPTIELLTGKMIWNDIFLHCATDRAPLKYCLRHITA